jgi:hypothetical protein
VKNLDIDPKKSPIKVLVVVRSKEVSDLNRKSTRID